MMMMEEKSDKGRKRQRKNERDRERRRREREWGKDSEGKGGRGRATRKTKTARSVTDVSRVEHLSWSMHVCRTTTYQAKDGPSRVIALRCPTRTGALRLSASANAPTSLEFATWTDPRPCL